MPRRPILEVTAVVLTAALHFLFTDFLPGRGAFIAGTVIAWLTYVSIRVWRHPDSPRELGLSRSGLVPSAWAAGAVLVLGTVVCSVIGSRHGPLGVTTNMLLTALLYPLWGIVQQTLVQGMAVRHLARAVPRYAVVIIAGLLFGAIHLPHLALACATAVLGCAFTIAFLRYRNVWALGVCHGWLGVLFYYWVLGRDPWLEIVSQF